MSESHKQNPAARGGNIKTEIELSELLKQITPLPWIPNKYDQLEGSDGANIRVNGVALTCGYTPPSDVAFKNSTYLTHCANVLPELVELIDRIHRVSLISSKENQVRREWLIEQTKAALSRAEKVKLP